MRFKTLGMIAILGLAGCGETTTRQTPQKPTNTDPMAQREAISILYHADPEFCVSYELKNRLMQDGFMNILQRVESNHINCINYGRAGDPTCSEGDMIDLDEHYLKFNTSCVVGVDASPSQKAEKFSDIAIDANLEIL